jgi:hypothetical protein
MRLFLLLALVSFSAFATDWSDLEAGNSYKLNQSFQLPQLERSGSLLEFTKGEKYLLSEILPVDVPGYPLMLYIFKYTNCPGPAMKTDMEIVEVETTSPVVKVGMQVEACEINMYIETKDYYSKSLFE